MLRSASVPINPIPVALAVIAETCENVTSITAGPLVSAWTFATSCSPMPRARMCDASLVVVIVATLPTSATFATVSPESVSAAPSPKTRMPEFSSVDIVEPPTAMTSPVSRKSLNTALIPGWLYDTGVQYGLACVPSLI